MSYFDVQEELAAAVVSVAGISQVYDLIVPPEKIKDAVSPYVCIGDMKFSEGRTIDENERTLKIDVYVWAKYQGKKVVAELTSAIEEKLFALESRDYHLESGVLSYNPETGWSLAKLVVRCYYEAK